LVCTRRRSARQSAAPGHSSSGRSVVPTARDGRLCALGTLDTQDDSSGPHPPLVSTTKLTSGKATMTELWYRQSDANCCPSGERVSTWTLEAPDMLVLSHSKVTS
jgi:hypothetical protein